jgi:hypothetical protein
VMLFNPIVVYVAPPLFICLFWQISLFVSHPILYHYLEY